MKFIMIGSIAESGVKPLTAGGTSVFRALLHIAIKSEALIHDS